MILRNKSLRHNLLPVRRESPKVLWNFPKKIARRSIIGRRSKKPLADILQNDRRRSTKRKREDKRVVTLV